LIYIDDMSSRDVGPFAVFEQRLLRGLPQLNAVLDALADVLFRMCDQYETPTANSILTATFEFVNSTCIEPDIETLPLVRGCTRFPWFLRDRTGVAIAFALMLFPKSKRIGVTDYIQALPDMNFWISVTNDLLSCVCAVSHRRPDIESGYRFHKEDIAGEKANYVYNRSYVEEQAPLTIIAKMEKELQMSRKTIYTALKHCPHAIDVWCMWELGYVCVPLDNVILGNLMICCREWHLAQQRYKLRDLGL
jgi:hypothetical protein